MTPIATDVSYAAGNGQRQSGDLYLPDLPCRGCALLIHGGGWINFSKERMVRVAEFLGENGLASFAVNYPLISQAPWPACGDACLAAGRFIQAGGLDDFCHLSVKPLIVLGASAGGHLALMTGLRLPGVAGIASIAGVTDLRQLADLDWFAELVPQFFGVEAPADEAWETASPLHLVEAGQPALFLSHDHNDAVVPFAQAAALADRSRAAGTDVDFYAYRGPGHSMWLEADAERPRLHPGIEARLLGFLERVLMVAALI